MERIARFLIITPFIILVWALTIGVVIEVVRTTFA